MTLLEVVIAMMIIGLGMAMSIAMIQTSVKSSISAHNQDAARMLLVSISDRMRINSYAASAYRFGDNDGDITNNTGDFDLISGSTSWSRPTESSLRSSNPAPTPTCIPAPCTPKQIKEREDAYDQGYTDVSNWAENVENALPKARAAILELPNDQYRILIQWQNIPSNLNNLEDTDTANDDIPTQEASLVFRL